MIETKQSFSPEVVDKFIQRQGRMLRGVKASSPEEAITYFTNPSPKGFETTRGPGIYTSNSTDIAKQFSNRGYIGDLSLDFGIASNESPPAVGEAIQQLTTLEQSRRDRIQEAAGSWR